MPRSPVSPADASYWMTSESGTTLPGLTADLEVDVVIVGGGIVGLSTAYEVLQTGCSVAVLEAGRLVSGVTGHTTAKVTALHGTKYSRIASSFGPEAAQLYAQSQQDAIERLARLVADLGIECELERVPAYTYARDESARDTVVREAEAAAAAGLAAQLTDGAEVPEQAFAAVVVPDQLQFHPRRYLLHLARAVVAAEGLVFENSRVVGVDAGDPCVVRTADGHRVRAGHVVIATNYPVLDRAMLFPRLEARRELVVAGPIPGEADPGGMFYGTGATTRSVRTAPLSGGRRLAVVTGESFLPGEGGDLVARWGHLEAWAREHFPLEHVSHRWAAQDAGSADGVPFVGPVHGGKDRVHVATGFGGWGMTNGVMSGRLLAAQISGEELPWQHLYDPRRFDPRREAKAMLTATGIVARRFAGARLKGGDGVSIADIAPGGGAVVRSGVGLCAVHRDEAGTVHGVSARCTHLGCIVRFSEQEKEWQCPCHGSRFGLDGGVLQGPATAALAPCGHDHGGDAPTE